MKIILSLVAVAAVMGFAAPKAEAHDRSCKPKVYRNYCPPPQSYYNQRSYYRQDPCYRQSYNYRPQYYSNGYGSNCQPRRYYRSSGFSITIVR